MTTTMTLSAAQEAAYNLLQEKGVVSHEDLNYHQRKSFKALEARRLAKWREGENGFEWVVPEYDQAPPRAELPTPEVAEQTAQPVPNQTNFTPTRWQHVECLKAFPKKGEAGVWIQGRYMGVLPGDPRYVSVRINGLPEAVKVGDVRPVGARDVMPLPKPAAKLEIVQENPPTWTEQLVSVVGRRVVAGILGGDLLSPKPTDIPHNGAIEDAEFKPVQSLSDDGIIVAEDGYDPRQGTPFARDQVREFVSVVSAEAEPTLDDIEGAIVGEMLQEAAERAEAVELYPVAEDSELGKARRAYLDAKAELENEPPFTPEVGMTVWWERADGTDGHSAHVLGLFPTHASIVWFKQQSYPEPAEQFMDVPLAELHETNTRIVTCESVIYEHQVASGQPFPASITPYFVRPVEADKTEEIPAVVEPVADIFNGMAEPIITAPVPQPKPQPTQKPRKAPELALLGITPAKFKQVRRGIVMCSDKVFSRHNAWKGEAWLIGTWTNLALALTNNGNLLMLDGALAYQVRTTEQVWDTIATAWFGIGWQDRNLVIEGGMK